MDKRARALSRKRRTSCHRCGKRRHGQPKIGKGCCIMAGERDRIIRWRQEARALKGAVVSGRGPAEE